MCLHLLFTVSVFRPVPAKAEGMMGLFCFLSDVKFEIDLPKKLVWIESDRDVDSLMETLKKCGKEVKYNGPK